MAKQNKSITVTAVLVAIFTTGLFLPGLVGAGDLEPSKAPGSTMHTLNEIYNLVENINAMVDPAPCGPCDPTGAGVEKTGQTTSYATGDDGDYEIGVASSNPRFTDNYDGTVTDNLTGLIWLRNANCFGNKIWTGALSDCNGLADAACGLSDGSSAGDWRLPNIKELQSLIDFSQTAPALPSGHPFTGLQIDNYWSGTTWANGSELAWGVSSDVGFMYYIDKNNNYYVWPVRGGN
jgi:hypothetical protein